MGANDGKKNLIQYSNRFTPEKAREYGRRGGIKSGESRRRKANFRKVFNTLLTAEIDSPQWREQLEAMGLECNLESALAMAMIKEGLAGNVKAFEAIGKFAGQSQKTDKDEQEQDIRIERAEIARDEDVRENASAEPGSLGSGNPFEQLTTEELRRLISDG